MTGEWVNHVWQSTAFAAAAGLLTLAFRKNRAQVRYGLWLSASVKFLIPLALLLNFGSRVEWKPVRRIAEKAAAPAVSVTVMEVSRPFPEGPARAPERRGDWAAAAIAIWACGFAAVSRMRWKSWRRIRAALRASAPAGVPAAVEVRSAPGLLEPGVVGIWRPVLLAPEGITERLTAAQLEAVIAHECAHVRRRDNLTAAVHMVVEALFWFHPMVWWIGARLVEERERACDEAVLRRGGDPRDYAEAIVSVCRWYVESPLACVAGVTGADIKKRLEAIMTGRIGLRLNHGKRLLLAGAAIAAVAGPMAIGLMMGVMHAPAARAQAQPAAATPAEPVRVEVPAVPIEAAGQAQASGGRASGFNADREREMEILAGNYVAPADGQALPPHPLKPAGISPEDYQRRVEFAAAHFGRKSGDRTVLSTMGWMYAKYGPPDRIDDHSNDPENPAQTWRYNFLADFGSAAEFEFPMRDGVPLGPHINWPKPLATFLGVGETPAPVLSQAVSKGGAPLQAQQLAGFPGQHISMDVYPAQEYRVLNVPLDGFSGPVRVVGQVFTMRDGVPNVAANFLDQFAQAQGMVARMNFTLDPGSYVCDVVALESNTGREFGEKIEFEVK